MTDNQLIRGIRDNEPAAWREIYWANYDKIQAKIAPMLVYTRDRTFDDLFEESLLSLMGNIKDGRLVEGENTNLSGYLYRICWRKALRWETCARRCRGEGVPRGGGGKDEPETDADVFVDPEEYELALELLERVLASLSEQCRSIFRRFYWDRLPMSEIAAIHGLKNQNSAKTTKNRCMEKFKELAKTLLADDERADQAVRRVVERDVLRDLLEEIRREKSGDLAAAALKDKKKDS